MTHKPETRPRTSLPTFAGFCRWCQHSLLKEDAYCPSCGKAVEYGRYIK